MTAPAAGHDRTTVVIGYDGTESAQGAGRWAAEYAAANSRRGMVPAAVTADVDGASRSSGARDSPPRGQELLNRALEKARTRVPQLLISVDLREGRAAMS